MEKTIEKTANTATDKKAKPVKQVAEKEIVNAVIIKQTPKPANGNGRHENGHGRGNSKNKITEDPEFLDSAKLLTVLVEMKSGNFNVRMPVSKVGITGKICDTLNDIIVINKNLN